MQQQADEDELGLSSAALAALKEFALENDMLGPQGGDGDIADVRLQVQERMDVKERAHDFRFTYGDDGDDEQVCITLIGVNPELGQTLASTGLTVWRAAQEMARFMWEHRDWFVGKSVVELGAGLGLCGVLASKLCTGGTVVVTDGGEEFTDSALDALRLNLEKNSCNLLPPATSPTRDGDGLGDGLGATVAAAVGGAGGASSGGARVALERLTWGGHAGFLERYGVGSGGGAVEDSNGGAGGGRGKRGFDYIVAADVLYEEEAVSPLLHTVVDILRLRQENKGRRDRESGRRSSTSDEACNERSQPHDIPAAADSPPEKEEEDKVQCQGGEVLAPLPEQGGPGNRSTFLLAFARRNVSIERVLREAESLGLAWRVPDDFEPATASENIYLMSLR